MSSLWGRLDAAQRRSLAGIGSDLNGARRGGETAPKARRPEDISEEDKQRLQPSADAGDWHALLFRLRICETILDDRETAFKRFGAYLSIGLGGIADVYLDRW